MSKFFNLIAVLSKVLDLIQQLVDSWKKWRKARQRIRIEKALEKAKTKDEVEDLQKELAKLLS